MVILQKVSKGIPVGRIQSRNKVVLYFLGATSCIKIFLRIVKSVSGLCQLYQQNHLALSMVFSLEEVVFWVLEKQKEGL